MKDASSCKIQLNGLSIVIGQMPESKTGDIVITGKPTKEIKIDELVLESKLDYQFDEGELKDTNNAVVEVFKQVTNLSLMLLNTMVKDKAEGREHELAKIEIRHANEMATNDKRHENEMAKLRLVDELDDLKNKRIHERERYSASKL